MLAVSCARLKEELVGALLAGHVLADALYALLYFVAHGEICPPPSTSAKVDGGGDGDVDLEPTCAVDNTEEVVTGRDVDVLYAEAGTTSRLPKAPQPAGLGDVTLRPYQLQALHWLRCRENAVSGVDGAADPLLQELLAKAAGDGAQSGPSASNPLWEAVATSTSTFLYINPYSRLASLHQPPALRPCR